MLQFTEHIYVEASDSFWGFWSNLEIQNGGPKWPPFEYDDEIPTSGDVINPFCGRQRKQFVTYYLPTNSHCYSFNGLEDLKGGGGAESAPPPPPGSGTPKKPRLINIYR